MIALASTFPFPRAATRKAVSTNDSIAMTTALEDAARELADRRRAGRRGVRLPAAAVPADVPAALALQRRVAAHLNDVTGGWKCALPTPDRTIVAPLFASTIKRTSPCVVHARGPNGSIEAEIAFVLARDLPPRATPYAESDIRAAIGATHLVLELIGNRYADPSTVTFPEMLADFANNEGLYVGPAVAGALARPLERIALEIRSGTRVLSRHDGAHSDGHPLRPLVWLANFLPTQGDHLRAGQIVTTGAYAGVHEVPLDTPLSIAFGDLGVIDITLTAAR